MTKEELKNLIDEATKVAKEEATKEAEEKGLNKDETKKYIANKVKEAVDKVKEENPVKDTETEKGPKVYEVYTPVKDFNGEVAGVQFAYGKAIVREGWILNWFKEKGYKVKEIKEAK